MLFGEKRVLFSKEIVLLFDEEGFVIMVVWFCDFLLLLLWF